MKTLTIDIPDTFGLNDNEVKMALASKLYETGRLSLGQTATLTGYSKQTFMELLVEYGVSLINHSPDELDDDVKNAEKYCL
ncbi:MAG: UPF0175 family protein [Balneolales bacterium]|nr:UPF0175 family protein [Balneolales bacterium]